MSEPTGIRPPKGPLYEARRAVALWLFGLAGWKVEGTAPEEDRFVVIAAPHTSNWDLPYMLAVAFKFRIKLRWMGKDSLFKPPFGWLMKAMGGIPIDRSKANNVVTQMVEIYRDADILAVAIPPEGTRANVRVWKTGFYNIAHGAGVPIALGFLDYQRKVGGIGGVFHTTGDYEKDLGEIQAFYAKVVGKHDSRSEKA
ncbi:lysophospholipid acyltransferase family protein [Parvularcula lutaonensis]|uniref:Lysophospholipid acyltransferase family protein n=1 Tax=Parvularcula lutaonensis TaxID=491923 RepID=A0ABV7MCM5_9PROT|nr:lysophospholipid acyltransferase family protein [Parvularcula lutaonensis]GGY49398.1 acyltransferase [Parvularcula lutaonensis]